MRARFVRIFIGGIPDYIYNSRYKQGFVDCSQSYEKRIYTHYALDRFPVKILFTRTYMTLPMKDNSCYRRFGLSLKITLYVTTCVIPSALIEYN